MKLTGDKMREWIDELGSLDLYGMEANAEYKRLDAVLSEMREAATALDDEADGDRESCEGDGP